jgi:hypothetical protein
MIKSFLLILLIAFIYSPTGDVTYFDPSGIGACGRKSQIGEMVAAVSASSFKGKCGMTIKVTSGGKSVTVKVVDKCSGCNSNMLDLSPAAFARIANKGEKTVKATWEYI